MPLMATSEVILVIQPLLTFRCGIAALQALGHVNGRRSPAYAACGRNTAMIEYDLLMTLAGTYD